VKLDETLTLGHIHESMLPGALYDPDLEPSFPPVIMWESSQREKDIYSDWWNHDKVAAYILTSHLFPAALGTIPIANSQLGQRRSARMIYVMLKNNYGAGDYSAVMAIEAQLRRLKCLPARGVSEFKITSLPGVYYITRWRLLDIHPLLVKHLLCLLMVFL
jgi:hypothetical protein